MKQKMYCSECKVTDYTDIVFGVSGEFDEAIDYVYLTIEVSHHCLQCGGVLFQTEFDREVAVDHLTRMHHGCFLEDGDHIGDRHFEVGGNLEPFPYCRLLDDAQVWGTLKLICGACENEMGMPVSFPVDIELYPKQEATNASS